jgi:arsenate reductase (glutaredoxin)
VEDANATGASTALRVYEKPTCTTCRKLRALLAERGISFESIDYHQTGLGELELRHLLEKMGVGPREILRRSEPLVKELGLDDPEFDEQRLITLMVERPQLVQRPIVLSKDRAVLARPIERVLELLD